MEIINILIPNDEVGQKWLIFQQDFQFYSTIINSGISNIQYGKAILNFNNGVLQSIQREEVVYKR